METLHLVLLVLAAVLLSSVIDQIVPKVSSPLIQIALGILIALVANSTIEVDISPDLFIILFIVPLLYEEAKTADKAALWKNRAPIVSLAIGLVVLAAVACGFFVNWLIPSIPIAAAIALGAALGPTDAVAVASLSKEVSLTQRQQSILKGESLINDASGIVSFQFAIAAAATGLFSIIDASTSFLASFFGGIGIGLALGLVANLVIRAVRALGLDNTTFHVLFEVFSPFIAYLAAEFFHVSGILAVVAMGLVGIIQTRTVDPQESRLNIVSSSVWRTISFTLNGMVFVLLGAMLPGQMQGAWENMAISNLHLLGYVLAISAGLYLVRFLWIALTVWFDSRRAEAKQSLGKQSIRSMLVMTFSGARGAITLSLVMTIPFLLSNGNSFPQRSTIIFLASGVIIVSLLVATFIVPLIAPKPEKSSSGALEEDERDAVLDILRAVIEELTAHQTRENRRATQKVIRSYNKRIARLKDENDTDEAGGALRIKALRWEQDRTLELIDSEEVDPIIGYQHLNHLGHIQNLIKHQKENRWVRRMALRRIGLIARNFWRRVTGAIPGKTPFQEADELRTLQIATGEYAVSRLQAEIGNLDDPAEEVSELILEYQQSLIALRAARPSVTAAIVRNPKDTAEVEQYGLRCELEQIQAMYEADRISRATAKRLRENVHLMQIDLEGRI